MTTASDNFNRANETPLSGGGNWTNSTATGFTGFNLSGNLCVPSSPTTLDSSSFYSGATWGNNQSSSATLTVNNTGGSGVGPGLCVRRVAAAATETEYRLATDHAATNNVQIIRFLAGVSTSLLIFTQAWTDGDRWELRAVGPASAAVVSAYLNSAFVTSVVDNSSLASGSPGIAYSASATSPTVDNWIGTDSFANVPGLPNLPFYPNPTTMRY